MIGRGFDPRPHEQAAARPAACLPDDPSRHAARADEDGQHPPEDVRRPGDGGRRHTVRPSPAAVLARAGDMGIGEEQAADSLEILEDMGLAPLSRVHGRDNRGIFTVMLSDLGFDRYLDAYVDWYGALMRDVRYKFLNSSEQQQDADKLAAGLGAPVAAVRRFQERNLVHAGRTGEGKVIVVETRPQLRRRL